MFYEAQKKHITKTMIISKKTTRCPGATWEWRCIATETETRQATGAVQTAGALGSMV